MHPFSEPPPDEEQPGEPGVSRLRDLTLHVEMEDRPRPSRPQLREAPPARAALAFGCVARNPVPDEIDGDAVAVGRPVPMEILEESVPVGPQPSTSK